MRNPLARLHIPSLAVHDFRVLTVRFVLAFTWALTRRRPAHELPGLLCWTQQVLFPVPFSLGWAFRCILERTDTARP